MKRNAQHPAAPTGDAPARSPSVGEAPPSGAAALLALQRQAGNRAVGRLIRRPSERPLSRWPWWLGAPLLPDRPSDPVDEFVAEVGKIAAAERRATDDELEMLARILDRVAGEDQSGLKRRELEKEILLWPRNFRALDDIVELVTGARNPLAAEQLDRMDAAAARFDDAVGE